MSETVAGGIPRERGLQEHLAAAEEVFRRLEGHENVTVDDMIDVARSLWHNEEVGAAREEDNVPGVIMGLQNAIATRLEPDVTEEEIVDYVRRLSEEASRPEAESPLADISRMMLEGLEEDPSAALLLTAREKAHQLIRGAHDQEQSLQ